MEDEQGPGAQAADGADAVWSRRTVFRLGAVAAATVAAGATLVPAARTALAAPTGGKALTAANFRVRIGDTELKFVRQVQFGAVRTVLAVVPGSPPSLTFSGLAPSMTIRIEVLADTEESLAKWYDAVKRGNDGDRREVLVDLLAPNAKTVIRTFRAQGCIVESFETELGGSQDKGQSDVYVLRCPLAGGGLSFEEP